MASESLTPPPASGGGYAKYLIVLLLLVGGGLGVFLATRTPPPPPKAAPPLPVKNAERSTALTDDTLEIPEDEAPDAGTAPVVPGKKPVRGPVVDGWACQGDLAAPEIRKVLGDAQTQIRSCYERRLRNDNQLQGTVNLQVKIGNDGKVSATRVRGSMRDNEVRTCIQNLAKKWAFPAPSGGSCAVFDAPYNFTPKN